MIQLFLIRKKILALFKFMTNSKKLAQAGMAMVNMLLLKGIHPDDIF
ncbi:MAG: hypothetical protein PV340_01230 [Wolbachia sp.]|nr:hypothetical protein [Wolbachia sp.]